MTYEETLYEQLIPYLKGRFSYVAWQVPFMSTCIDLVAISTRKKIYTFEVKMSNWRAALKQAVECSLCSDFVYVAVPEGNVRAPIHKASLFRRTGVGLISVGPDVEILLSARKSEVGITSMKQNILGLIAQKRERRRKATQRKDALHVSMQDLSRLSRSEAEE